MFHGNNNAMMHGATYGTSGQKQRYEEPDWCTPPASTSQQPTQRTQTESRDNSWGQQRPSPGYSSNDERDVGMSSNHYQYPVRVHSPPRQRPSENHHFQLDYNSQEVSSYLAAIKSVNEDVNNNARGNTVNSTLSGLWKVFDAAVLELGSELCDSLSNKAVFEGKDCRTKHFVVIVNITSSLIFFN